MAGPVSYNKPEVTRKVQVVALCITALVSEETRCLGYCPSLLSPSYYSSILSQTVVVYKPGCVRPRFPASASLHCPPGSAKEISAASSHPSAPCIQLAGGQPTLHRSKPARGEFSGVDAKHEVGRATKQKQRYSGIWMFSSYGSFQMILPAVKRGSVR